MSKKAKCLWILLVGLSLVLSACGPSTAPAETATQDPNAVFTAAAETANARMTELAAQSPTTEPATPTLEPELETATVAVTEAFTTTTPITTTAAATAPVTTAQATTPVDTGAGAGAGAGASAQGDNSEYVADVTIPDGTVVQPNESFTKTWTLQNTGTTTWTTSYALVFADGAPMTTTTSVPLAVEVGPGETVDISVNMTAPADPGTYQGFWRMANADGTPFGTVIYVDINVGGGASAASSSTPVAGAASTPGATATGSGSAASGGTISKVTLGVDNATVEGDCPHTFDFPASITLSKDAKVTYRLEAGSSTEGFDFSLPEPTTGNLSAGTHTFNYTMEFSQSIDGWARLHVTSPEDVTSTEIDFSLTCE